MRLISRAFVAMVALSAFQCSLLPAVAEMSLPDPTLPIAHKALRTLPEILARMSHEGWSPEEVKLAQLLLQNEKYISEIKLSAFEAVDGRRWLIFLDPSASSMSISTGVIHDPQTGAPLPFHMMLSLMLKAIALSPRVWPSLVENDIGFRTVASLARRLECPTLLQKTPSQENKN